MARARAVLAALLVAGIIAGSGVHAQTERADPGWAVGAAFTASTGDYSVAFRSSTGTITVSRKGKHAALEIRELPGGKSLDLLYAVRSVRRAGFRYTLRGASSWASFTLRLDVGGTVPGLLHLSLTVTPRKDAPAVKALVPDVRLVRASAATLAAYAPAPPIAGTSVMLSARSLDSTVLYLSDFTALGSFFGRTSSGPTQPNFPYPNAGGKGSLVGLAGKGYFGYVPPVGSVGNLPLRKSTVVVDSYLYLLPGLPSGEVAVADTYLKMLGTVYGVMPHPSLPGADWKSLAEKEAQDLLDPSNWVTVNGTRFLRSYVSDTRSAPELITQAGVLAGVKAYEARYHVTLSLDAALAAALPAFYDSSFHRIVNGLGHDPNATGESWYFVDNMISLLQLARLGSANASRLLLASTDAVIALAHTNNYEFPQSFRYSDWNGKESGLQADVAGGYAWLMLGLSDLTGDARYLDEAKRSIAHVSGKGFTLSYETHMTAYAAAAAQRLYRMTGDTAYRGYALLALANLFHATRLWDCTYGSCAKGSGYHTVFGLNPLPWSDYTAMLEQYEAWLALRDYAQYSQGEQAYLQGLVGAFITASPLSLRYSLAPSLPAGAATAAPAEYDFVPKNNLGWYIPLEDLREGESTSGVIGQEIYGAGGPFMFAAYGP